MALVELRRSIEPDSEKRVDLCVQQMTNRSRSDIRGLFAHGCVTLNGEPCTEPGTRAQAGDELVVRHNPHQRYHAPPPERQNPAFKLMFEDQQILVVDKAAHILTVATDRFERNTLVEAVTRHLKRKNPRARPGIVHRLDRGTSGLLVFGVTPAAADALKEQFRIRKAERAYLALVAGVMTEDSGTFSDKLRTVAKSLKRHTVDADEEGEEAITHFEVIERLKGATLVKAQLETGRRNQIRVHFSSAGHPVLGDDRYAEEKQGSHGWKARRLALHASTLGFDHPATGKPMRFESPWPEEFSWYVNKFRVEQ